MLRLEKGRQQPVHLEQPRPRQLHRFAVNRQHAVFLQTLQWLGEFLPHVDAVPGPEPPECKPKAEQRTQPPKPPGSPLTGSLR